MTNRGSTMPAGIEIALRSARPVAVYLAGLIVTKVLASSTSLTFVTVASKDALAPGFLAGAYTYYAACVFLYGVVIAALFYFASSDRPEREDGYGNATLGVTGAILVLLLLLIWFPQEAFYDQLTPAVFGLLHQHYVSAEKLRMLVNINESITAVAAVIIVVGSASAATRARAIARLPRKPSAVTEMARLLVHARTYLLLGSALLAVGVVMLLSFYLWPQGAVQGDDGRKQYAELVQAFILSQGANYVAVLAVMYLPAAWSLHNSVRRLARDHNDGKPESDRTKWMEEHGLTVSVTSGVLQAAATLAPLLAGPIGSAFLSFTGS